MRPPVIVIQGLDHARAALSTAAERGIRVVLRSAPGAAAYLGAAVFREIVDQAAADHPNALQAAVLDCGDSPGHALAAFRHGIREVRLEAPPAVRARVADIAQKVGCALDENDGPVLDLGEVADPKAECERWLDELICG